MQLFRFLLYCALLALVASAEPMAVSPKELSKMRREADTEFVSGQKNGPKNALKKWNKIIKLDPDNHNNYYKRYRVLLRLKKTARALSDLESAVKVKPSFTSGWSQHAKLLLKLGRCVEADVSLQKALTINPTHKATIKLQPAITKCASSVRQADDFERRGQWAQADAALTKALDAANTSPTLFLRRARLRMRMGKYFEVLADSGKVLKWEKHNLDALGVRAHAYYLLGDHEMAMRHQREGLKSDPGHKGIKVSLGWWWVKVVVGWWCWGGGVGVLGLGLWCWRGGAGMVLGRDGMVVVVVVVAGAGAVVVAAPSRFDCFCCCVDSLFVANVPYHFLTLDRRPIDGSKRLTKPSNEPNNTNKKEGLRKHRPNSKLVRPLIPCTMYSIKRPGPRRAGSFKKN